MAKTTVSLSYARAGWCFSSAAGPLERYLHGSRASGVEDSPSNAKTFRDVPTAVASLTLLFFAVS